MKIKKILLLSAGALAVAALAAPAGASATMLYRNGAPIEEAAPIELVGNLEVSSLGGGVDCQHHMIVDTRTTDAEVTSLTATTNTCVGTGVYLGCKVIRDEAKNLPYTADYAADELNVTGEETEYELECPFNLQPVTLSVEVLHLKANNPEAIETFAVSGEGLFGEEPAEVAGEFEIVGEGAGEYSLAE